MDVSRVDVFCSAAESDVESSEWAMEQEEAIESLLCETASLLPAVSLAVSSCEGPQASKGPALAPAAQTAVSGNNQGKGMKVGEQTHNVIYCWFVKFVTL